ncbi:hypothetical protein NQ315_001712 [Exocentrus adspersus]|uniref:Uncharacterized protein n=1 Tax=Exocentrus adspersus TaxID=1586481 RepID=A0AAV8W9F5_9CUCU|nr:hypothetical protein NQ315_001712 [Exocentrus adspersus]
MPSALTELCKNLQADTEKLEAELKNNIAQCHKLLIDNKATATRMALEKAKDYHYKEVLDILKDIVNNIRKIIFHEQKIKKLNDEVNITPEELKRYSYVQRQVQAFSNGQGVVTKREKRRVASEISVESLEAWELYLEKKEEEEKVVHVEKVEIPKRKTESKRRKKKFVSSTFNNFLDGRNGSVAFDKEEDIQIQRRLEEIQAASLSSINESDTENEDEDKEATTSRLNIGQDAGVESRGKEGGNQIHRRLEESQAASLSSINESDTENEDEESEATISSLNIDEDAELESRSKAGGNQIHRNLEESQATSLSSVNESDTEDEDIDSDFTGDGKGQERNLSTLDLLETLNQELEAQETDTKPKIVEVIYKKKGN